MTSQYRPQAKRLFGKVSILGQDERRGEHVGVRTMLGIWVALASGAFAAGACSHGAAVKASMKPTHLTRYQIDPIGHVRRIKDRNGKTIRTRIVIEPRYRSALLGLRQFSHVIVLYWFHKNDRPERRATLRVHPCGNADIPLTGVFATRSPRRPNLIAHETCKLRDVHDLVLELDDIDAFDGSPVIDIKPYIPVTDAWPKARVPSWIPPLDARNK